MPPPRGWGEIPGALSRVWRTLRTYRLLDVPALAFRELTLKKGDIVYIHKEVDKNWLEGEHHGRLGIFPANYVEVSGGDEQGALPGGQKGLQRLRECRPPLTSQGASPELAAPSHLASFLRLKP